MVAGNIPMNAGCLKPINIVIPEDCMLSPEYPAAVVAGNVETSQHVTNACSARSRRWRQPGHDEQPHLRQRTYQYYETICSGSPALGRVHDGTTRGVHTHMTASRLTDPEIRRSSATRWCWRISTSVF
jgi:5-oxoprolinase (ATP-hydrolysing)